MNFLIYAAILGLSLSTVDAFHAAVQSDESKYYCIILEANITGTVQYETHDNKTSTYPFHLDETTLNASGSCISVEHNRSVEALAIEFKPENVAATVRQWRLNLQFVNDEQNTFRIFSLTLFAYLPDALNSTDETVKYELDRNEDLWAVTDKNGYTCSAAPLILRQINGGHLRADVQFEKVRALAFAQLPTPDFPAGQVYEQCLLDTKTSDVVPIVVGACLAGLVIVVLVAYLIGRARARRQGYASV